MLARHALSFMKLLLTLSKPLLMLTENIIIIIFFISVTAAEVAMASMWSSDTRCDDFFRRWPIEVVAARAGGEAEATRQQWQGATPAMLACGARVTTT
jgi:hypothetical protein